LEIIVTSIAGAATTTTTTTNSLCNPTLLCLLALQTLWCLAELCPSLARGEERPARDVSVPSSDGP
jgi:hypothetical protein